MILNSPAARPIPYSRFVGLDSVTDKSNMSERYLQTLKNAYCDFKGQIIKAPGSVSLSSDGVVTHVRHYGADDAVYFAQEGSALTARSRTNRRFTGAFSSTDSIVNSTTFTGNTISCVKGQKPIVYDGAGFVQNEIIPQAGVCAVVLNRLCVSDIPGKETEVQCSQLDKIDFTTGSNSTDGLVIDVRNQLTGRDVVRALATLEGDKLAIFCRNETLLYAANTDQSKWTIVRDFRAPVGVFGRNTVVPVGQDLFFCSRTGVHSLRRAANGLTLETIQLNRVVENLYQSLVEGVVDGQEPQAVWNSNLGQYTVFFPTITGSYVRLVFTYEPALGRGGFQSWSYATSNNLVCGSAYAGELIAGSADPALSLCTGEETGEPVDMVVRTPILWQGAPNREKQYKRLFIRAAGDARFTVNVYDENDQLLQSSDHQPFPPTVFTEDLPFIAPEQVIDVVCEHRARGVQLEFICTGSGTLKILDFAISVEG